MVFVLLSPAKTLAFDRPRPHLRGTTPHFQDEAMQLAKILRGYSPARLGKLMGISDKLAALNVARFDAFAAKPKPHETDLAILAFQGDVYKGLDAASLSDAQLKIAQNHIGMLSGIYGVLQPFDLIQPYRLEMGTALPVGEARNLYEFWGDRITRRVNALIKKHKIKAVIGCASEEYLKSVDTDALSVPFIQCAFKENKGGKLQIVALFAKKARGMMARFAVEHDVQDPEHLQKFTLGGYKFDRKLSDDTTFVFTR